MTFASILNKTRYDFLYQTFKINIDNRMYFRLHQNYIIFKLKNHKLFNQKVDLFLILKKINKLIFRFKFSLIIRIYSIMFIT